MAFHPMTVEQGLAMLSAFRCGGTMLIHSSTYLEYMFMQLIQYSIPRTSDVLLHGLIVLLYNTFLTDWPMQPWMDMWSHSRKSWKSRSSRYLDNSRKEKQRSATSHARWAQKNLLRTDTVFFKIGAN